MDTSTLRVCRVCFLSQEITNFYTYKNRGKQYFHTFCKTCQKKKQKEYREKLGKEWNNGCQIRRQIKKARAVQLMGGKCMDCQGIFPDCVYDFHHPDPSIKEHNPGNFFHKKWSHKIEEEIKKLILVCANCHRIRHHG